jgi:hypothetical protein
MWSVAIIKLLLIAQEYSTHLINQDYNNLTFLSVAREAHCAAIDCLERVMNFRGQERWISLTPVA